MTNSTERPAKGGIPNEASTEPGVIQIQVGSSGFGC